MSMRLSLISAAASAVLWSACGDNDRPPGTLTIEPSGQVDVTEPTEFVVSGTDEPVTWTLDGGGTLSGTTGFQIVYRPPPGTATATLTATAGKLTASVQIGSSPRVLTGAKIPGLTAPVTVQYDAQDVPHIECAATADCVAVQGYVQARDRWFPMDFLRHVARARLAELIGLDGLAQDVQLRTILITRAGHRLEADLAAAMDPDTRAIVDAYVRGINAYLTELRTGPGARLPGEYAQLPVALTPADLEDWTVEDTLAIARLQQFQLSESLNAESAHGRFAAVYSAGPLADLGKINAWIRAAAPPTERAHTLSPAASFAANSRVRPRLPRADLARWSGPLGELSRRAARLADALRPADGSVGSNNWVVAGAKSETGAAMVANDPHLGLQYPPLFHLAALRSTRASDNLDLTGGAFPGIPGALIGRGAHVGWGVTVVGYDVTDLYLEQFVPQGNCPTAAPCVLFKGAPVATLPVPQTYLVRVAPGATGLVNAATLGLPSPPPPVVLVVPHHGPIIQAPDAAGKAISVRWTGHEGNTQDVKAIIGLNTATDVDDAIAALKDFATGAQNFVLADDQGHIAYDPHALVPVRRFADARVVGANVIPPWFPLPGDGTAEWGDGSAACAGAGPTPVPASCWIADDELPQGKDPAKGYFFTANADPTSPSVSDDNNPLAHPPYLSFDWDDSSGFRATRIEELLEAAIASGGKVTLDEMKAIQSDHVSRPGKALTALIAAIPTTTDTAAVTAARGVLAQWAAVGFDCPSGLKGRDPGASAADATPAVQQASAGCMLFHAFLRRLLTNVFADDLAVAGQGVNGLAGLKAMIFMLGVDASTPQGQAATKFCNDVGRQGQLVAAHTCAEQTLLALGQAYSALVAKVGPMPADWVWGRVHTMRPVSLLALITTGYEPGPFARPGGAFTVDVATPSLSGAGLDFAYRSGANVRHISVMSPTPVVEMQLPGPQRDEPATFVGPDLLGQWVDNSYFHYAFGDQIDEVAVSIQTFKAR